MARKTVRRERKDRKTERAVVKSKAGEGAGGPEPNMVGADAAPKPTRKASRPPDLSWQAKGIRPGSDVVEVELKDVDAGDTTFQCRVTTRNLKTLMDSIRMEGQLEPVRLRGKQAPYQIVSGFSRIEAIRQLRGDRVIRNLVRCAGRLARHARGVKPLFSKSWLRLDWQAHAAGRMGSFALG